MSILDQIISVVAPFECLGCSDEGSLLCSSCKQKLSVIPSRCYKCHKLTEEFRTCKSCRKSSRLHSVQPVTTYEGTAKLLVARLKFYGTQTAADQIARTMIYELSAPDTVVVPVPTATSRARQRGYDQAKLIARSFAKLNKLPYLDCLARSGQSHQVGSKRQQRRQQLKDAYRIKAGYRVEDLSLILVDDVVTTGATLESAAACLRTGGAKRVVARVFAQA